MRHSSERDNWQNYWQLEAQTLGTCRQIMMIMMMMMMITIMITIMISQVGTLWPVNGSQGRPL